MNYSRIDCRIPAGGVILFFGGAENGKHVYRSLDPDIKIFLPYDFSVLDEKLIGATQYEVGYREGASSATADWIAALNEYLDIKATSPTEAVSAILQRFCAKTA